MKEKDTSTESKIRTSTDLLVKTKVLVAQLPSVTAVYFLFPAFLKVLFPNGVSAPPISPADV